MELQVGVKILLKNKEGMFLVLQRNLEKYPGVGAKWDIAGGRIKADGSLLENLKREVMEESGLELVDEPELIFAQDIFKKDEPTHVVRLTYTGEGIGEVKLSEEHSEFRWLTRDELAKLEPMDKYIKEVLDKNLIND
jgi:8-oxo-dGTP diphosphatase